MLVLQFTIHVKLQSFLVFLTVQIIVYTPPQYCECLFFVKKKLQSSDFSFEILFESLFFETTTVNFTFENSQSKYSSKILNISFLIYCLIVINQISYRQSAWLYHNCVRALIAQNHGNDFTGISNEYLIQENAEFCSNVFEWLHDAFQKSSFSFCHIDRIWCFSF